VTNSIGDLFRDYGEEYILNYNPSFQQIKLIRAIRLCKTPALGSTVITCKDCGQKHFIHQSCGHSHCMICQSIKREQWVDKLKAQLLKVPYVHAIFTLPHQLNGLARSNEAIIYSIIMKSAWLTIKAIGNKQHSTPGMTSILHTFGSDMKYHIHVHALVTFGGLDSNGEWIYPKYKDKLDRYRSICAIYKAIFLKEISRKNILAKLKYHADLPTLLADVAKLRWVVHATYPTMDTTIIENYLAKYINRIAVSNKRLQYIKENQSVSLIYNDYKIQLSGQPAPKAFKNMEPLVAINQIMQHVLPPYFQKSRRHGIHNAATKIKAIIPAILLRNGTTIRTIFQIITDLLKLNPFRCDNCGSSNHVISSILPLAKNAPVNNFNIRISIPP
jgi:Putative transposase/Transposase zinc-binding domain